ncbi:hypothetical protein ZWY2020_038534 [Hordeum vulgare]|nr:hypothetical protein ZWY2020_038534 [Hordeum vulgare]
MASIAAVLLVLLPLLLSSAAHSDDGFGFQATLTHIDAGAGYTDAQLLSRAVRRSRSRVGALQSLATAADAITAARILVQASQGEYLMSMAIGTPPRYYSAILDTGSDLIWTQCAPCMLCVDQPTPYFDPTKSSSYAKLSCSSPMCNALYYPLCYQNTCVYQYFYGDSANTAGVLANETFTFGTNGTWVTVPSIAFGCAQAPRFSYCLTSFMSPVPSRLYFNAYATLNNSTSTSDSGPVQSTPFIINPALPTMYYLNMTDISVGGDPLHVEPWVFAINEEDGTGGVIIDSGSTITYLAQPAYDLVHEAFVAQVGLPLANVTSPDDLSTCFKWPPPPRKVVSMPELVFHFEGADMELPLENYMLIDGTGNLCLAMAPSDDGSIIGSFQHANFHVLYDNENSLLSFIPAPCNLM